MLYRIQPQHLANATKALELLGIQYEFEKIEAYYPHGNYAGNRIALKLHDPIITFSGNHLLTEYGELSGF